MIRSNEEIEKEQKMLVAFRKQAQGIISSNGRFTKNDRSLRIGLESEVAIYHDNLAMYDLEKTRDAIIRKIPDITDVELGVSQIEFRTPPIDVLLQSGFRKLTKIYKESFNLIVRAAKEEDCFILRAGANPFLPIKNAPRTNKPKYYLVPDYYNKYRSKSVNTVIGFGNNKVDIGDAAVVSLLQSFQINLEARSLDDACDKMNRSLSIAPYLLAISPNARFLESRDTGMSDLRMISWERSFDLRTQEELEKGYTLRMGLPEKYFSNISDYFKRMERYPFIMYDPESALQFAIGMAWLDTRVKFIDNSAVVELRLLSTQPTVEEELLLTLLYIGRLANSQLKIEQLMPIRYVRENRLSAMLYGSHGRMWFLTDKGILERLPCKVGIRREVERAKQGLERLGLIEFMDDNLLQVKLNNGSPSDALAKVLYQGNENISTLNMKQALKETGMLI